MFDASTWACVGGWGWVGCGWEGGHGRGGGKSCVGACGWLVNALACLQGCSEGVEGGGGGGEARSWLGQGGAGWGEGGGSVAPRWVGGGTSPAKGRRLATQLACSSTCIGLDKCATRRSGNGSPWHVGWAHTPHWVVGRCVQGGVGHVGGCRGVLGSSLNPPQPS